MVKSIRPLRLLLIPFLGLLLLNGCSSVPVQVETVPDGARITERGSEIGRTPMSVNASSLFSRTFLLSSEGYLNETITIDQSDAPKVRVELTPRVPVSLVSDPEGVVVSDDDGRVLGTTPYEFFHLEGELTLILSKKGYLDQEIVVSPRDTPEKRIEMSPVSPGNLYAGLSNNLPDGDLIVARVFSSPSVAEAGGNADALVRITDIGGFRVIDSFSIIPGDQGFALSLIDLLDPFNEPSASSSLWTASLDGRGGLVRRTESGYFDLQPTYSPDGEYIFFSSNRAGGSSIFRISATGRGGSTLLTSQSGRDNFPDVNPSGNTLFYSSFLLGLAEPQIWSQSLPDGPPSQFRSGLRPKVSPNGEFVIFSRYNTTTESTKIWRMRSDGSEVTELASSGRANDLHPSWSPDGGKIVFSSDRGADPETEPDRLDIWIMDANGSNVRQLTTNPSRDDLPVFSLDGESIYFRSNRGNAWNIWRLSL